MPTFLCGIALILPSAYASENDTYSSPLLNTLGITEDEFATLPIEKQEFYADKRVHEIVSTTKYYKVVLVDSNQNESENLTNTPNVNEKQKSILVEVSKSEYEAAKLQLLHSDNLTNGLSDSDSSSGTWYSITANLVEVENGYGVPIGEYGQYAFSMTATIIGDKLDSGFHTDHVGYIAGSLNEHCSPIKNSELCTIRLYPVLGGSPQYSSVNDAPYKGYGYGFNYSIGSMASKAEITMMFSFEPRQSVSIIDAYGHLGYWDDNTSVADISVTVGPVSASASPTKNLVRASDLHLQLRV